MVVLTNMVSASVSDAHPAGVAELADGSVPALRHELSAELAPANGPKLDAGKARHAAQLLAIAPLDPIALTYLALVADKKGDIGRARRLMTLALRSDGRSVRARLWLMDQDLRHRRYGSAIDHFDRLVWIGPRGAAAPINVMAGIVRDPASHAPLARKLATNPSWRGSFLYALNQQGVSPDVIYQLTPQGSAKSQVLFEQSALLQSLLKNKEYERAYLAWINFLPEASLKQLGPVYDPQFQEMPGPLPFNWKLSDGIDGSSEFSKPRGLNASYLGGNAATLAEQTLLLSPGRYRLSVIASGSDENNQLSWTITCQTVGEPLRALKITGLNGGRQRYTTQFDVPAADCGAQRLALVGSPVEFPRTTNVLFESATVELVK
jgi:hypothetical protein